MGVDLRGLRPCPADCVLCMWWISGCRSPRCKALWGSVCVVCVVVNGCGSPRCKALQGRLCVVCVVDKWMWTPASRVVVCVVGERVWISSVSGPGTQSVCSVCGGSMGVDLHRHRPCYAECV